MTILEASKRLNVSKTTIRNYMTPEFKEKYCSSRPNGAINISTQGFLELSMKMDAEKPTENDQKNRKPTDRPNRPETDTPSIVEFLQAQITAMNEQIAKKDEQIKALQDQNLQLTASLQNTTESLKAAQLLHAADKPQLLAEATNDPVTPTEQPQNDHNDSETTENQPKKHWWQRKK